MPVAQVPSPCPCRMPVMACHLGMPWHDMPPTLVPARKWEDPCHAMPPGTVGLMSSISTHFTGIPSYNHWREFCGLPKAYSFYDLKDVMRPEVIERFQQVYQEVDDIDLFPAAIAEEPLHDGLLGPTFTCLITKQFVLLKKGDRFWYENDIAPHRFTPQQLDAIRKVTMSSIICANGDHIETLQENVFMTTLPNMYVLLYSIIALRLEHDNYFSCLYNRNERKRCQDLKPIDLKAWKEVTDKQIFIKDAVKGAIKNVVDGIYDKLNPDYN